MNTPTAQSIKVWGALALLLTGLFVFAVLTAVPRQPKTATKAPFTIGVLISSESRMPIVAGLKDGLSALGVNNFSLAIKNSQGDLTKLKRLLDELIGERPDYILAIGGPELDELLQAKTDIPKFFAEAVLSGRRSTTFPGVVGMAPALTKERMEFAQKILPNIKTFTVVTSTTTLGGEVSGEKAREFATENPSYLVKVLNFNNAFEISAFAKTISRRDGAIFVAPAAIPLQGFPEVLKAASAMKVPVIAFSGEMVDAGALFSYGDERYDSGREAAYLIYEAAVKKTPISSIGNRTVKPSLVINKKVADSLGIDIPADILRRAAKIVE